MTEASALIEGCIVENNSTSANGGGLWISIDSIDTITITDTIFRENSAGGAGAGFYVGGNLNGDVTDSIFSANSGRIGSGFFVSGRMNGDVRNNRFDINSSYARGGGFFINSGLIGNVAGNSFRGNFGISEGGFHVSRTLEGDVTNNTFIDNFAPSSGGGFLVDTLRGDVKENTFWGNRAGNGGGCFIGNHIGTMEENVFLANIATSFGGAIGYNSTSDVIRGNTFSANSAAAFGGAIYVWRVFAGEIDANLFSENSSAYGGALALRWKGGDSGYGTVSNNIFVRNTVDDDDRDLGGAIDTEQSTTIVNNLFVGATGQSSIRLTEFSDATILRNNIFMDGGTAIVEPSALILTMMGNNFFRVANILSMYGEALGTSLSAIDLLVPGFSNNYDWNPELVGEGIIEGVWTGKPVFDSITNETTIKDRSQKWTPNQFSGALLDLGSGARFPIVANTAKELIVMGNLVIPGLILAEDPDDPTYLYSIDDYHLSMISPNIDAGADTGLTSDFEGGLRPLDGGYDIGPDEFDVKDLGEGTASMVCAAPPTPRASSGFRIDLLPLAFVIIFLGSTPWRRGSS